jgi:hypothetical protein
MATRLSPTSCLLPRSASPSLLLYLSKGRSRVLETLACDIIECRVCNVPSLLSGNANPIYFHNRPCFSKPSSLLSPLVWIEGMISEVAVLVELLVDLKKKNRTKTKGEWTGKRCLNFPLSSPASYTSVISIILLSSLRSNNIQDLLELNHIIVIIQDNQQRLINRTPSHHGSLPQERIITPLYHCH